MDRVTTSPSWQPPGQIKASHANPPAEFKQYDSRYERTTTARHYRHRYP